MKPGAEADAAKSIASRIRDGHDPKVQHVRGVPGEQALARLKSDPDWADALSALPNNPLPDAIVVTLVNGPELAKLADTLAAQWRKWDQVDRVQLDSAWVRRLEAILGFLRIGLGLLAVGVALVVLAPVFNTIPMQALMQREEIGVARLVGCHEAFVTRRSEGRR